VIDENQAAKTVNRAMAARERDDIRTSAAPIEIDIHQASLNGESVSQLVTVGREAHTE
jgi:hypothetical protein